MARHSAAAFPVEVDVIVVGSGAAGLAAAIAAADTGASVLMLERSASVGGTTAVSGGVAWVPGNAHAASVGVADDPQSALRYVRRVANGSEPDGALLEAFLEQAPRALEYLEAVTPLRMQAPWWYADYFAQFEGGAPRGRSVEPCPYDLAPLGDWADRLRRSPVFPSLTMEESSRAAAEGELPDMQLAASRDEQGIVTRGVALVGPLLEGLLDRGVTPVLRASVSELRRTTGGRVGGVIGRFCGIPFRVRANLGVVLASGGFEWNRKLVGAFLGGEVAPLSPPFNTGDALRMAIRSGAELANMNSAWWYAAVRDPTRTYEGQPLALMDYTRVLGGSIVVNRSGRRFVNEGACYATLPRAFDVFDPVSLEAPNADPWLVFDEALRSSVSVAGTAPDQPPPSWMTNADTVGELAARIGINRTGLEDTVARFNEYAAQGRDPDFGRGTTWWEGWSCGGPDPARNLAPLTKPPFYAIPLLRGVIGTNGGPLTDAQGRVRAADGGKVPGLFAAGNAAASPLGTAYPGAGTTLGIALTFGIAAGRAAAQVPAAAER